MQKRELQLYTGKSDKMSDKETTAMQAGNPMVSEAGAAVRHMYDPDAEEKAIALLERIRSGDEDAFRSLTEQYGQLVDAMVHRFALSLRIGHTGVNEIGMGLEELRQDGYIALYRAAMSYDPEGENKGKAVRFGLYAKICIRNAFVSEVRRYKRELRRREKQRETAGVKSGRMEWIRMNLQAVERDRDASTVMQKICESLSSFEKAVFMNYIKGKPPREIAAELGRTEKSVSNAIYRIKAKNKGLLEKNN